MNAQSKDKEFSKDLARIPLSRGYCPKLVFGNYVSHLKPFMVGEYYYLKTKVIMTFLWQVKKEKKSINLQYFHISNFYFEKNYKCHISTFFLSFTVRNSSIDYVPQNADNTLQDVKKCLTNRRTNIRKDKQTNILKYWTAFAASKSNTLKLWTPSNYNFHDRYHH